MDRGAWRATVQGVTKSWTRMSSSHFPGGGRWHNFLNSYTLQTRNILWLLPVFQVVLVSKSKDIWDSAGPRWDWNLGPSHSLLEVCFLNAQAYSALCVPAQSRPTLLWPHGLSPARLLCPWNFPGKNTGAHRCFLLQGIFRASWIKTVSPVSCIGRWTLYFCTPWEAHIQLCACVCLVTQLSPTLLRTYGCSLPGSSVHGFLQASIVEQVAIPFSRGSSQPKDWTRFSCIAGRFFTVWATREASIQLGSCRIISPVIFLLILKSSSYLGNTYPIVIVCYPGSQNETRRQGIWTWRLIADVSACCCC